jgi:hypothetical protein
MDERNKVSIYHAASLLLGNGSHNTHSSSSSSSSSRKQHGLCELGWGGACPKTLLCIVT